MKLSDIARLAGVSVTTASYVINGKAVQRRISAATVARVQAVVQAHDYRPDVQAAGLRGGQTRSLGFILPDLENPSYARLAKCLERGARARGYQLLIASSDDQPDTERQLLNLFRARRCDALIVASCLPGTDHSYQRLQDEGLPVIAVDRELDAARFCSVVSDDHDASRHLTRSLMQAPSRHIALLGARPELVISQARSAGFREALEGSASEALLEHGEAFSRACGRRLMERLLERLGHLPDALVTTAYVLLEGVFDVLKAHGEVFDGAPERLRLGTFGDTQMLDFLPLPVNSMAQQHDVIAEQVLHLALLAVEQGLYRPGVQAVPRTFKERRTAAA
ncbi:MAG: catabolite repressor/activator [Pseudomonas sp.]|uniref:catabolite repressor/activator n=1 Tax=Pseudomonas sp. TaxID=306 RepID=UPI00339AB9BF